MINYDDEINDLLDRVETLEEGGGGEIPSASGVKYEDSVTQYGSNIVQGVLEIVKAKLDSLLNKFADYLPNNGGTIDGELIVTGLIDGTTSGNALPIMVDSVTGTGSIGANTNGNIQFSVAKDGYVPLGIVGVFINGSSQCYPYRFYLNGTSARFYVRNNGSGAVDLSITANILYQLDNGIPMVVEEPTLLDNKESI